MVLTCVDRELGYPATCERSVVETTWKTYALYLITPVALPVFVVLAAVSALVQMGARALQWCIELYDPRVKEFHDRLERLREASQGAGRAELRAALQDEGYKARFYSEDPDVVVLQRRAFEEKQQGKCSAEMARFGQWLSETYAGEGSGGAGVLHERLEAVWNRYPGFHRNILHAKCIWFLTHPRQALEELVGEGLLIPWGWHPEEYNSARVGNLTQNVGSFVFQGKRHSFCLEQGLGQEREIDMAALEYQRKNGLTHYRHTLECPRHKGEGPRVEAQKRMAATYPETLTLTGSPFDGPAERGYDLDERDPRFVFNYFDALRQDTVLFFDARHLTSDELIRAFDLAEEGVRELTCNQPFFEGLPKDRKAKVCLLYFTLLVQLKTLTSVMAEQSTEEGHTFTAACKQDVDRAVVLNCLTLYAVGIMGGHPLSPELKALITGIAFSRAALVDDRAPLKHRFIALLDTLRVLDQGPHILKEQLRRFIGDVPLRFELHEEA